MLVSNARHVFLFCLIIAILGWNTPIKYSYGAKLIHMGEARRDSTKVTKERKNCETDVRRAPVSTKERGGWAVSPPFIAKDMATTMPRTEYEAILKAQHFDLIYA